MSGMWRCVWPALLLLCGAVRAQEITLNCDRWKQFCEPDGSGFYFELVRRIFPEPQYRLTTQIMPYKRAVHLVIGGLAEMTIGVYPNEVSGVVWPKRAAFADDVSALMPVAALASWQGEESLRDRRVLWLRGWGYEKYVTVPMHWHEVDQHEMAVQLLEKGRYDYYLSSGVLYRQQALPATLGWRFLRWLPTYPIFVDNPKGQQLAQVWDQGMARLLADGTLERLYRRYDLLDYFGYYRQVAP